VKDKIFKWLLLLCILPWCYVIYRFETLRLFTAFIPLIVLLNVIKQKKLRNTIISLFVILWLGVFHYESVRYFYLQPHFDKPLYKVKYLFPPAGWIMFFRVGSGFGYSEVLGVKNKISQIIDPHDIFRTRSIMFDNIHRGILGSAADKSRARPFCRYLNYRFPYFDSFMVTVVYYPSMIDEPYKRLQEIRYQCINE